MRRLALAFSFCLVLVACGPIGAQTIWNPCGCGDQAGYGCGGGCSDCGGGVGCCRVGCGGHGNWRDPNDFQAWELRPFGVYNEHIMGLQRRNGIIAQMVFYSYDFSQAEDGSWSMSAIGLKDAQKICRLWPNAPGRVLVEPTGVAEWDAARRGAAVAALTNCGLECTLDEVVVGTSHIQGLVPMDPEIIYGRRQQPSPYMRGYTPSDSLGSSPAVNSSVGGLGAGSNAGTGSGWGNSGSPNQN